jgi:uncharacterized protein (DUF697 family)
MSGNHLAHAAIKLAEAVHKAADEHLPEKLSGIVKLHAGVAVGAALIPVPGADVAAAAANIWTMYVRINRELDLPFGENVIKSVGAGVATNIGGSVATSLVLGSALKLFPGIGTVPGIAIVGATVYGVTIVAGIVYMNAIAALLKNKSAADITEADLKAATSAEMKNKSALKEAIKAAGQEYKPETP